MTEIFVEQSETLRELVVYIKVFFASMARTNCLIYQEL